MTTSKKIIVASYIIAGVLSTVTVIATFMGLDVTALGTIAGLFVGEVTASNAFYFNKAKKENALKIALGCIERQPTKTQEIAELLSAMGGL